MNEEVLMRLISWNFVLTKAASYLAVGENLESQRPVEWLSVELYPGKTYKTVVGIDASMGLREAAVVLFRQVFNTGKAGTGIAGNHDNEIKRIREELVAHAKSQLPAGEFERVIGLVNEQRNERLAHYDGSKAEFRRPIPQVAALKMPGCCMMPPDIELLRKIIAAMSERLDGIMTPTACV